MTARYNALRSRLQPSVAQWVVQQAAVQKKQTKPDLGALRATVRARLGGSLAAMDVDALVFLVMMEAAQSSQSDLQQIMQQVQADNQAKQSLRGVQEQLQQAQANLEANARAQSKPSAANEPCVTPACAAIAEKAKNAERVSAASSKPLHYAVGTQPTRSQIAELQVRTKADSDSLNDLSEQLQLRMQMEQQELSQAYETISNIMKTMSDTSSAVIQNLK
jgi:hypothetical protein